tara:strand:- start:193 stop:1875 length:1683 start_codon:yes stop_codon:yes gene_type:complete
MRLAIIHKEKCKPTACGHECKKFCPVEKREADSCVTIKGKARIDEKTCNGCGICVRRCPFEAIEIINLPSVKEEDLVYRFGENSFALYGLPVPKQGKVVGMLGRNGIGKSTTIEILAGKLEIDAEKFKGTELQKYFDAVKDKKVAYKPQNLSSLAIDVKVIDLLKKREKVEEIKKLAKELNIENVLENKLNKLSGGELQRVAIIAASLGQADIYFFDEPLAYLDIGERLRVSDFISRIAKNKTVVVVEHDLLILDYLTDYLNIFFGSQGAFGLVSGIKTSKAGVNAYLQGFLKEENLRIRDKELNFNFTKNPARKGKKVASWSDFEVKFYSGFKLNVKAGEIHENHVVGILGKNGTGKTSFVRALAGELDADVDLGKLDVSYKSQYLFTEQEEQVRDIMIKEKITKKMSSIFNLGMLQQKKVKQLSGGELQRFSVARCLAKNADIYLIDEPSAYLDVEERIAVAKAIKEIMTEKEKTAFVVDHDLLLISYLADNVLVFSGESGVRGESSEVLDFEEGISKLLKDLDVTLRKDKESGRPRINKHGSVLDREQKAKGKYAIF